MTGYKKLPYYVIGKFSDNYSDTISLDHFTETYQSVEKYRYNLQFTGHHRQPVNLVNTNILISVFYSDIKIRTILNITRAP